MKVSTFLFFFRRSACPLVFAWFLLGLASCHETPEPVQSAGELQMTDDTIVKYNHEVVREEQQEIEDFIHRYHWNMQTTQTGLRWMVYRHGKGIQATRGDLATINYTVRLINGDMVYRSDSLKPFDFVTGKAAVPNGLEEGVLLLREGDRARLIVPSHLAFGLLGDMDKIKNRAILVYDVEICRFSHPKRIK